MRRRVGAPMATESFEDLIVGVLDAGNGEDAYWTVVDVLGRRADEETLHAAIELTHSASPPRRQIGVDILATLGPPQRGPVPPPRPFLETVLPVLLHLGEVEPDAAVMDSVVSALRHQHDPRALSGVLAQVRHVAAEVRLRVAMVLP